MIFDDMAVIAHDILMVKGRENLESGDFLSIIFIFVDYFDGYETISFEWISSIDLAVRAFSKKGITIDSEQIIDNLPLLDLFPVEIERHQ